MPQICPQEERQMEKTLISTHTLRMDRYSLKSKIRTIIIGWLIFAVLLVLTRRPAVQTPLIPFAEAVTVRWVSSWVDFIVNDFWGISIFLLIGTVVELVSKQTFQTLNLYTTGAGFVGKDGAERFADYSAVSFSYRKGRDGFWAESKTAGVKLAVYGWKEFTEPDVLRTNLTQYGGLR
jgi:hypothetical protein